MKSGGTENIMSKRHLAIDLGASNGRAIVGTYTGSKFDLEEIHRFSNDPFPSETPFSGIPCAFSAKSKRE